MAVVEVRGIRIGEGAPKICVPLVGGSVEEYMAQAKHASKSGCDMVELRIDYYKEVMQIEKVLTLIEQLRQVLTLPILFTFRSAREGGEQSIQEDMYNRLYEAVLKQEIVDLIDLELSMGEETMKRLVPLARDRKIKIVMSQHNFIKTPPKEEMIATLVSMQQLGADIPKIAVMPVSKRDVLQLMETTVYMHEKYRDTPVVGISMGTLGVPSRLLGGWSSSAITFGTVDRASAPGQVSVDQLKRFFQQWEQI